MTDSINRIICILQATIPTEEPGGMAIIGNESTWGIPPQSIASKITLAKDLLKETGKNWEKIVLQCKMTTYMSMSCNESIYIK